jgi:hypothetical protein
MAGRSKSSMRTAMFAESSRFSFCPQPAAGNGLYPRPVA